jgi:hypothetical protein
MATYAELGVKRYRRVLRPELSVTGSCGLCIAASDRIYRVRELMPIHPPSCKCTTLPIVGDDDPGRSLNRVDLDRLYAEAGSTAAADLRRTRYKVNEHGEFGPVLTRAGDSFRGPGNVPLENDPERAARMLEKILPVLDSLEVRAAAGEDVTGPLIYQRELAERLREIVGDDAPRSFANGGSSGGGPTGENAQRSGLPEQFGPVLGSADQQNYTRPGGAWTPRPSGTANGDHFYTYIADPDDRTTALLQYLKGTERLVKQIAADLASGRDHSTVTKRMINQTFLELRRIPESGISDFGYTVDDLTTDLNGAARTLLAWNATRSEPLGPVYRGIKIDFQGDLTTDEGRRELLKALRVDLLFASATPTRGQALGYAIASATGNTKVVFHISDAQGIRLSSVGRLAESDEVLITGHLNITGIYTGHLGEVIVEASWRQ